MQNSGEIADRRLILKVSQPIEKNGKIVPKDFCRKWLEIESEVSSQAKEAERNFLTISKKESQIVKILYIKI